MTEPMKDAVQVKEALQLVCSNKPRPSVQKGAKGNEFWKRDVHHLANNDRHTLCGTHRHGWLTMRAFDPKNDIDDPNLCVRCKAALAAPSPAALDPVTVEALATAYLLGRGLMMSSIDDVREYQGETWLNAIDEVRALLAQTAPTGNAPEPVAWQARDKKGGIWRHCDYPHSNPDFEYRPLYAAPASNPQEAVLRTCATCHAVLADGPQPAAAYASTMTSTDHAKLIPPIGKNRKIPMPEGFSLVEDGRFCAIDDPDCRYPKCDCARYRTVSQTEGTKP